MSVRIPLIELKQSLVITVSPAQSKHTHSLYCGIMWVLTIFFLKDFHANIVIFRTNFGPVPQPIEWRSTAWLGGYTLVAPYCC